VKRLTLLFDSEKIKEVLRSTSGVVDVVLRFFFRGGSFFSPCFSRHIDPVLDSIFRKTLLVTARGPARGGKYQPITATTTILKL
jgi:hypothetical protein